MRKILQVIALCLAGLAPLCQASSLPSIVGGGAAWPDEGSLVAEARDGITLDEAVSRAERQHHARVVRTDVQDEDGRKVYVLKLLSDDGRVFTVRIDAATGRMR
ncbi:MAG TPA: PepSY domain-containing protein [Steroidobacteraceae bacterium]|nr:PepSY domain-containing protein [Steroidobacteraceae bacterium]